MKIKLYTFLSILLFFSQNIKSQHQNISNGTIFEGEPYIVINPNNPQNIVVAWMGFVYNVSTGLTIKVKSSFNGGQTWSTTVNIPHINSSYQSADPSMAFDGNGNLFLSYIDHRENPDSGGVYIRKSVNGGLTWGNPIKTIDVHADGTELPIDRPWLTVNAAGDKIYIVTKPAPWIPAPNRPYFIASVDSGATWQPWRYLDTTNYLVGNLIAQPMAVPVCSGNKFHAMYPSYVPSQNVYAQYLLATTINSGNSFTYKPMVVTQPNASNDTAKLAYKLIQDPSNNNHLAFIYLAAPFGDIDIMLAETFNSGLNWSTPQRVNDDPQGNGKMQDMLWADFDSDGDIIITWRDRRNASGIGFATASEFYGAFRDNDSANFSSNFPLSDGIVSYNSILAQNGNDFMSTALLNDTLYTVYANTKDGSLDVWFVKMAARTQTVTGIALIGSESDRLRIMPNPSAGIFTINALGKAFLDDVAVYTMTGKKITSTTYNALNKTIDLSGYPKGIYLISVVINGQTFSQKVVLAQN
ncbi:MAG: T9SS type A sorting domain-containing protein [Bacteroidota bacterium]